MNELAAVSSAPRQVSGPASGRWSRVLSLRGLIFLCALVFLLSMLLGLAIQAFAPKPADTGREAQNAAIEKIFGPYRVPVREGQPGPMAVCMGMVLGINLLGCVLRTIPCILVFPALTDLAPGGLEIGRSLPFLHGSSWLSVPAFLAMAALEWCCYVLSAAAGANLGLALVLPRLKSGSESRWEAFRRAFKESLKLYVLIGAILAVQASVEILYVRQVLLQGGTGVPLAPY